MSHAYAFIAGLNAMCVAWVLTAGGSAGGAVFNTAACAFCLWRMSANMKKGA